MNPIQEIKHWLEEGNLHRAEKAIQNCTADLKPEEKEEFENLLNEIRVRHYRLLAGKAIISKDESLLKICIQKIKEKSAHHEGLQDSLNQIISEKRNKRYQKYSMVILGFIIFLFLGFLLFS